MVRIGRFSTISLLALGAALPAFAQNTPATPAPQAATPAQPPAADEEDRDRDVVVVTANKREETVQVTQPPDPGRRLRESVRLSFLLLRGDQGPLSGAMA